MRTLLALAFLIAADQAAAGTLYKCVGPDGVTVYQQAACAGAQQDAGVRAYQREPDSPELGWVGQQELVEEDAAQEHYPGENPLQGGIPRSSAGRAAAGAQVRTIAGMHPEMLKAHIRGGMPINGLSAEAEELRRYENNQGSSTGRATNRMLYGDPPGSRRATAQNEAPERSRTIIDQNGKSYTTNPGSPMVTDNQTGRSCLMNGNTIVECY